MEIYIAGTKATLIAMLEQTLKEVRGTVAGGVSVTIYPTSETSPFQVTFTDEDMKSDGILAIEVD